MTPTNGRNTLNELNGIFPNHNIKFEDYLKNQEDVPTGENKAMKHILGVAWYADKFKAHSVFYFQHASST